MSTLSLLLLLPQVEALASPVTAQLFPQQPGRMSPIRKCDFTCRTAAGADGYWKQSPHPLPSPPYPSESNKSTFTASPLQIFIPRLDRSGRAAGEQRGRRGGRGETLCRGQTRHRCRGNELARASRLTFSLEVVSLILVVA